jgi:hypothetical protein
MQAVGMPGDDDVSTASTHAECRAGPRTPCI